MRKLWKALQDASAMHGQQCKTLNPKPPHLAPCTAQTQALPEPDPSAPKTQRAQYLLNKEYRGLNAFRV